MNKWLRNFGFVISILISLFIIYFIFFEVIDYERLNNVWISIMAFLAIVPVLHICLLVYYYFSKRENRALSFGLFAFPVAFLILILYYGSTSL
ncbi:hypothetical protein CMI47_05800, partial [Candidatus Pacearchaeota archaeon]|nr:hypothetical protein [Candidatus Pacearchaeota archaeon]